MSMPAAHGSESPADHPRRLPPARICALIPSTSPGRRLSKRALRRAKSPNPPGNQSTRATPRLAYLILFGCVLLMLSACTAGPNELAQPDQGAGFWLGLWQGLISPITFIVSLFTPEVSIYEVDNNGNWYDFGFMLGVCIAFSGGGAGGAAAPRRRKTR
jgi:hypothetical protein